MRQRTSIIILLAMFGHLSAAAGYQIHVDLDKIDGPASGWPDLVVRVDDGEIGSINLLQKDGSHWRYRSLGMVSQQYQDETFTVVIPAPGKAPDKQGELSLVLKGSAVTADLHFVTFDRKARTFKMKGTGQAVPLQSLLKSNRLNPDYDFACWRGPSSGGLTQSDAPALVTDPNAAVIRWVSSEEIAGYWGSATYSNYNSPIVHAGAVLLSYGMPSGTERYTEGYGIGKEGPRKDLIAATDTFLALDASTGQTRWKYEVEGGINHFVNRKKGVIASTPVAGDGRFFAQSSLAEVYAFDIATGSCLWTFKDLQKSKVLRAVLKRSLATKLPNGNKGGRASLGLGMTRCPISYIDEVVIVPAYDNQLIGLAAETGKQLWSLADCEQRAPLVWRNGSQDLLICRKSGGSIIGVVPKTGAVQWHVQGPVASQSPALHGDILALGGWHSMPERGSKKPGKSIFAYRLSDTGAERIWVCDPPGETFKQDKQNKKVEPGGYSTPLLTKKRGYFPGNWTVMTVDMETGAYLGYNRGNVYWTCSPVGQVNPDGRVAAYFAHQVWTEKDGKLAPVGRLPTQIGWGPMLAIADGRAYVRATDRIWCVDLRVDKAAP